MGKAHPLHTRPNPHTHHPHNKMAPFSDQNSMTPTPTNPDLQHTSTSHFYPPLPNTPSMSTHSSNPHDHAQQMELLEQIWSGLSLSRSNDETVSYVRIPVHPRVAMVWNQVTQTPSLPMRLQPPPQPHSSHMPHTHTRVHRSVHPYQPPEGHPRAPSIR